MLLGPDNDPERTLMAAHTDLRERLKKIEALVEGAATAEERAAAEAAIERVRAKLVPAPDASDDTPVEQQFTIADDWSRHLFVALCRRHGLTPYRQKRDDRTTVTVRAPRNLIEGPLWRQFASLDAEMRTYLNEVSLKIIREEIHADASDAEELQEALPAPEPELLLVTEPPPAPAPPPARRWFAWGRLIRFDHRGRLAKTKH